MIVAGAVAASLILGTGLGAVVGTVTPARADDSSDNLLTGLVALGALGVIVNNLDKNDHHNRPPRYRDDRRPPPPGFWSNERGQGGWRDDRWRNSGWRNDGWHPNDGRYLGPNRGLNGERYDRRDDSHGGPGNDRDRYLRQRENPRDQR